MSDISPSERLGEYMGYYQMIFSFCFAFGPWLGTVVFQHFGATVLWSGAFIVGGISALMMLGLKVKPVAGLAVLPSSDSGI
jgi:MFS family permease